MALKTAGCYIVQQLEFQTSKITRYGNPLDLSQDCWWLHIRIDEWGVPQQRSISAMCWCKNYCTRLAESGISAQKTASADVGYLKII